MNIQELRLGNHIKQGVIHNIGFSMGHSGYAGVYVLEGWWSSGPSHFYKISEIKPVSLTKEKLIEWGFHHWEDIDEWGSPDENCALHLYYFSKEGAAEVSWWKGAGFYESDYYVKLDYEHQLQNLYFALTGKELV